MHIIFNTTSESNILEGGNACYRNIRLKIRSFAMTKIFTGTKYIFNKNDDGLKIIVYTENTLKNKKVVDTKNAVHIKKESDTIRTQTSFSLCKIGKC